MKLYSSKIYFSEMGLNLFLTVIGISFGVYSTGAVKQDFCQGTTLNISCRDNEIIVITDAWFGHTGTGCTKHDLGNSSCVKNVKSTLNGMCAGKTKWSIIINQENIVQLPCMELGLSVNLKVTHMCSTVVRTIPVEENMLATPVNLHFSHYPISRTNQSVLCGTDEQPLLVQAHYGQEISMSITDLSHSKCSADNMEDFGYIYTYGDPTAKTKIFTPCTTTTSNLATLNSSNMVSLVVNKKTNFMLSIYVRNSVNPQCELQQEKHQPVQGPNGCLLKINSVPSPCPKGILYTKSGTVNWLAVSGFAAGCVAVGVLLIAVLLIIFVIRRRSRDANYKQCPTDNGHAENKPFQSSTDEDIDIYSNIDESNKTADNKSKEKPTASVVGMAHLPTANNNGNPTPPADNQAEYSIVDKSMKKPRPTISNPQPITSTTIPPAKPARINSDSSVKSHGGSSRDKSELINNEAKTKSNLKDKPELKTKPDLKTKPEVKTKPVSQQKPDVKQKPVISKQSGDVPSSSVAGGKTGLRGTVYDDDQMVLNSIYQAP